MTSRESEHRQPAQVVVQDQPGIENPAHDVRQDRFEHRIARFDSGLHRPEDSVAQVTTDMRQQPSIDRSADVASVEDR